jgi:hypothetical protein
MTKEEDGHSTGDFQSKGPVFSLQANSCAVYQERLLQESITTGIVEWWYTQAIEESRGLVSEATSRKRFPLISTLLGVHDLPILHHLRSFT